MPLYASGFFVPSSAGIPYILEDIYVRGGYRSVATIADRNAIKSAGRKQGAMVYVREDSTLYWLPKAAISGDLAWEVFDVTKYVNFDWQAPLSQTLDEATGKYQVAIDNARIVPVISEQEADFILTASADGPVWKQLEALPNRDVANAGEALILSADKTPIWGKIQALPPTDGVEPGSSLVYTENGPAWGTAAKQGRKVLDSPMGVVIVAGTAQRAFEIGCTSAMVIRLGVSHADLYIEIHSTPDFNDTNPYSFLSSSVKLFDDGITILEDGTAQRARRYGFFSNPNVDDKRMYIKVENRSQESADVFVYMTLLPLE